MTHIAGEVPARGPLLSREQFLWYQHATALNGLRMLSAVDRWEKARNLNMMSAQPSAEFMTDRNVDLNIRQQLDGQMSSR